MDTQVLPIYFGNPHGKHEINSDSLLVFIESYKEISEAFGLSVDIQIGIPGGGSWKTNLLIAMSFIGLNPFVALLTGETADDWAKKGNAGIVRAVNEFLTRKAVDIPEEFPRDCTKQKNKIYEQFQRDIECIDSFRLGDYPLIPRNKFHLYIKEISDDESIYMGETHITVHSPDWKGKRSWRGKIKILDDKESAFAFDKDLTGKFWEKIKLDSLPLHTTDIMRVQLIKRLSNKVKYWVVRVLSYNGEEIDTPISDEEIRRVTTSFIQPAVIKSSPQLDLFSWKP
jgi:hypothetical protein